MSDERSAAMAKDEAVLNATGIAAVLDADSLDDNVACEPGQADRSREQHLGHATFRKGLEHLVPP